MTPASSGRALWRLAALLATTAWLAACATRPPDLMDMPWTSGRLSVRVEAYADAPARSVSASFDLRGSGERGELRLTSPLGSLLAVAIWAPGLAQLKTSEGETRFSNLEALSQQALGETLPLSALPDWLAGRPWPLVPSQSTTEGFTQLGWQVTLTRWAQGWVDAERAAAPVVKVRARIER